MSDFPRINPMGERGILIEFQPEISEKLLEKLLFYKNKIEDFYAEVNVEVISTYNSLLISYMFSIENLYSEISALEQLFGKAKIGKINNRQIFYLPVCYDEEFGWDLDLISREKKLSKERIIELHSQAVYTVYFIGFLPGFLYLGGLDENLQISRKSQPRAAIEKGAVGIGENQTGIYPKSSPGGWQILGNCPVPLFDKNSDPPCEVSAGDKVKFFSVSREEFKEISTQVSKGKFQLKKENYEG
ncbi:KipI family sensor histidine kinase inhibitor [Salegentibacter sp. 24]|jgi:KipI family sensor histidine kinase inhibitor|uniref:5-oxoprolinase subunit PxpB n=1 Tax=Salegentibacter sp. 24 TaxID=2183986 RepID=UPI001060A8F1|nr:5-oxoprolinase subunit PxpB [Salegentibacter sp. 24]TDN87615.1 KipI family sensor histidine kinase inhibitor [Salegentibacter sp. 24]